MIEYKRRKKYRYNLHSTIKINTDLTLDRARDLGPLEITRDGVLHIRQGYAWDGPSGPTLHTRNFMRGSLVHDALYQLMREEILPQSSRLRADQLLREICRIDGMSAFRAWYVFWAVRLFAKHAAEPDLLRAP